MKKLHLFTVILFSLLTLFACRKDVDEALTSRQIELFPWT